MQIDMKVKRAYIDENELELNEKLYKLLEYLVINKEYYYLKNKFLIMYVDIIVMQQLK